MDNNKTSDLYLKQLSWLGTIRPSSGNNNFDPPLSETFYTSTMCSSPPTP